jgi:hypothetical protein
MPMLDLFDPPKPVRIEGKTLKHELDGPLKPGQVSPGEYVVTPARREALRRMNERSAKARAERKRKQGAAR